MELTTSAASVISRHADRTGHRCFRMYWDDSNCEEPGLSIGEDRIRENDTVFGHQGFELVVESTLLAGAEPVRIDHSEEGFLITSAMVAEAACGDCCGC